MTQINSSPSSASEAGAAHPRMTLEEMRREAAEISNGYLAAIRANLEEASKREERRKEQERAQVKHAQDIKRLIAEREATIQMLSIVKQAGRRLEEVERNMDRDSQ